jgi:hypothetical protein
VRARLAPDTHGSWFERASKTLVKLPFGHLLLVLSRRLVGVG